MQQFETNQTINRQLQLIEKVDTLDLFTQGEVLSEIVLQTKALVNEFKPDITNEAGRKKVASFASNISKLKTKIDGIGKELVSDWKSQAKVVDNSRKYVREELDVLKIIARKPLTDWENIEKEKEEKYKALLSRINYLSGNRDITGEKYTLFEMQEHLNELNAIEIDEIFEDKKEEANRCKTYNIKILKAIIDDEVKLEMERIEMEKFQTEKAEFERQKRDELIREQAKEKAKEDAQFELQLARNKVIQAENNLKEDIENARLGEIKKQADKEAKIKADRERREANNRHVGNIRREAKECLIFTLNIDEKTAAKIVMAIHDNLIKNITIKY